METEHEIWKEKELQPWEPEKMVWWLVSESAPDREPEPLLSRR